MRFGLSEGMIMASEGSSLLPIYLSDKANPGDKIS